MSPYLAQSRCFQHAGREAVARCPECERFYCRECVTEHEGRMICRSCLDTLLQASTDETGNFFKHVKGWALAFGGYFLAVYIFYRIGYALLRSRRSFTLDSFLNDCRR